MANKRRTNSIDHSSLPSSDENQPKRKSNTKVSYRMMPTYRFSSNLLFCHEEEQFYRFNTTVGDLRVYLCNVKGCKCRVHIRNDECYIRNTIAHNHEKKRGKYYNLCALNEVKRILSSVHNQLSAKRVFDDVMKR